MDKPDYAAELTSLRHHYVEARPSQRLSIAWQRIRYTEHGPNVLVACVAAVEGFARSLAMHANASTKEQLSLIYPQYQYMSAEELIVEYLAKAGLDEPSAFFGSETWQRFQFAVEFRNVMVHECTYLGQNRSPALIDACQSVLRKLASSNGLGEPES